jgi:hypothetical protein
MQQIQLYKWQMRGGKVAFFCTMYRAMEGARTVEERVLQRRRFWKRSEDFWIYTSLDEDKGPTVEAALLVWRKPRSLASDLCLGLCVADVSFSWDPCLYVSLSERQSSFGLRSLMAGILTITVKSHHGNLCEEWTMSLVLSCTASIPRG